jgi:Lrp/AsnC family leucine-responsive transcriptional regulator
MIDLDDLDRAILRALAEDGTLGAGELGRRLGLSQPAAWRRVKRLEEAGVLAGRRVEVDRAALGFGVTVFLGVKLATKGRVSLDDFERAVTAIPEVQVVQHVLGLFDYRLRVVARDIADFERVLRRRIMTLPGLGQVEANVLLTEERRPGPARPGLRISPHPRGEGPGEGGLAAPPTITLPSTPRPAGLRPRAPPRSSPADAAAARRPAPGSPSPRSA